MTTAVRIGLIGCGGIGRRHAQSVVKVDGAELTAVAEPSPERRTLLCDRVGTVPAYGDYREMIAGADLEAVLIALPTHMHAEASAYALSHGLHVLCEKPPATNAEEMARVAALARAKGRLFMFARQQRFQPHKLEARRQIAAGRLGRVYHAETRWMRSRGIPFRGGWGVNRDAGGGVLLDLGVHQIDDAWFVMGCPRPAAAFAAMHCAFPHLAPENLSMPYNADDATVGLLRFENGATLSFTVTFALHTAGPAGVVPASQGKKVDWLVLRVYGERAGVDVMKGKLVESQLNAVDVQDLPRGLDDPHPDDPFAAQTHEFVRAIRAGDDSMNTAEQAVMLMQMLDAVRESAHTGRSVEIAPVAA